MQTDNVLEVKNITVGYADKEIINNVSFSVEEAEFVGIIGPNGAGKTTLFRVITRVLKPWSGEVLYRKTNLNKYTQKQIAQEIAVMPQTLTVTFPYSIEEFVAMGRYPHLDRFETLNLRDKTIIEETMKLTEITDLKTRLLPELSGGEMRRVLLAQTLVQEPKLLLLDEPIAYLDIGHQIEVLDLVKKLNKEKKITVVAILHDLNLASEYCDKIILLHQGKVHKAGIPLEVLVYDTLETVYQTIVVVNENPISHKPHMLLVPQWDKNSD